MELRMKLNDLIAEFHEIEDLIIKGEGEITPEIEAMLDSNKEALSEKMDKYEKLKRYLKGQIEYLKVQENHYKKRRNTLSNTIEWLKNTMVASMLSIGKDRMKTSEFFYSLRVNESVEIDYDRIDSKIKNFLIEKEFAQETFKVNKKEIKDYYKNLGEIPEWMEISEKINITAK